MATAIGMATATQAGLTQRQEVLPASPVSNVLFHHQHSWQIERRDEWLMSQLAKCSADRDVLHAVEIERMPVAPLAIHGADIAWNFSLGSCPNAHEQGVIIVLPEELKEKFWAVVEQPMAEHANWNVVIHDRSDACEIVDYSKRMVLVNDMLGRSSINN
jgi:hypothetical protein